MKKTLLLLCLLPAVQVGAQHVLPDSVYVYSGENKKLRSGAALFYDEYGRKIQEKGLINQNGDDMLDENDQAYIIDWEYIQTDERLEVVETNREMRQGEWKDVTKRVERFDPAYPHVPQETYDYNKTNDEWTIFANTIGTEWNDKGLPVVLMDTMFYQSVAMAVTRLEVTYNEDNWPETSIESEEGKEPGIWTLYRKRQNTYNEQKQQIKNSYYLYDDKGDDWAYLYEYHYTYDEKGNIESMVLAGDEDSNSGTYYAYVYNSESNANESLPDDFHKAEIWTAGGQLHVTFKSDALFDVAVYTMSGTLIAQQTGNRTAVSFSVNSLSPGVYIVCVTSEGYIRSQKIIR